MSLGLIVMVQAAETNVKVISKGLAFKTTEQGEMTLEGGVDDKEETALGGGLGLPNS